MRTFPTSSGSSTTLALAMLMLLLPIAGCGGAEARRDRYVEKARALADDQNWEKAQLELRNALQIDPNDNRARVMLGEVAEKLGDPRQAAQQYRAVLDAEAENPAARAGLARLYALGGLPEEAMKLADAGLKNNPDDAALLTARAAARTQLGQGAAALVDAEKAHAIDGGNRYATAVLASLYSNAGRHHEAIALVEDSLARHPKDPDLHLILAGLLETKGDRAAAARSYSKLIALEPGNFGRRMLQVQFLLRGDEVDAAEASLRAAVAAAPKEIKPKLALASLLASKHDFVTGEKALLGLVAESPNDVELRVGLAEFYAANGRRDQAAASYQKVIEQDGLGPQGLVARNRLAAAALQVKDTVTAERLIGIVLNENPQDNDALAMRADIALSRGEASAAIADLRALLRDKPESVPAQRALAQAYIVNKDVALAEQTLRGALERAPGDAQLQVSYAQLLLQTGKRDQARGALEQAVAREPTNLAAQEVLFRIQMSARDYEAALKTAQTVRAARPDSALGDFLQGLVEQTQNKPELARASYERALKLQPDAAEPLTALAALLVSGGKQDEALGRIDRAIELRPANLHAHNLRAELLLGQKRFADATATYDRLIGLSPSWWIPYRGRATASLLQGDKEGAVQWYRRGLTATNSPELLVDLTSLQQDLGRPDDAIASYEGYLKRNPGSVATANNLAMVLVSSKSDAASLARAKELATLLESSDVATFVNTAGWVRFKTGDVDAALPLLQKAAAGSPDAPQLKYMLGIAQAKAGRKSDAIASLESALAMNRPFPGIADARATLALLKQS